MTLSRPTLKDRQRRVIDKLQRFEFVSDPEFDCLLSPKQRQASDVHFTSVEAARLAIRLLELGPSDHVLDVGSGVGKSALLFSLYAQCRVTGVELRKSLYQTAQALKRLLEADRVTFIHGDVFDLDWTAYTAIYLFNPFQEHLPDEGTPKLDHDLDFNETQYRAYVAQTKEKLALMPVGTRVLTYYGFGGHFPEGYVRVKSRVYQAGTLSLYEKMFVEV